MKVSYQLRTESTSGAAPNIDERSVEGVSLEELRAGLAAVDYAGPLLRVPGVGLVNATAYYEHPGALTISDGMT